MGDGGQVWVEGTRLGEGDVGDKVGFKRTRGDKYQLGVAEDEGNGGGSGEKEVWSMRGVWGKRRDLVRCWWGI